MGFKKMSWLWLSLARAKTEKTLSVSKFSTLTDLKIEGLLYYAV